MKDAQGSASGWELSIVFEMSVGQKAAAFTGEMKLDIETRLAYQGAPQRATHPKSDSRSVFDPKETSR